MSNERIIKVFMASSDELKEDRIDFGNLVRRLNDLYSDILARGHRVGNHTHNHIQGVRYRSCDYVRNVAEAAKYIDSRLFRPPHGHMRYPQLLRLGRMFRVVMWDVVTRDYSPHMTARGVFNNVCHYTRNGSIIVFHDSLKAIGRIEEALPKSIEWLISQKYEFKLIS
jgi:peptidoglycan/xylan/chitin deacetylase (PgdA/CDA1 family)